MAKMNNELMEAFTNYAQPININIRKDAKVTFFDVEKLKNAIRDSELIYNDNYEANRQRKMHLANLINSQVETCTINEKNIDTFDNIRSTIVDNTLFENMSNFCNLEIDEKVLNSSIIFYAKNKDDLNFIYQQCCKDLFILRILWFNNTIHKLLTELPLPLDKESKDIFICKRIMLRNKINKNAKNAVECVVNKVHPKSAQRVENAQLIINEKPQRLTEYAVELVNQIQELITINGYNKNPDLCLQQFDALDTKINEFYNVIYTCNKKALEYNNENSSSQER